MKPEPKIAAGSAKKPTPRIAVMAPMSLPSGIGDGRNECADLQFGIVLTPYALALAEGYPPPRDCRPWWRAAFSDGHCGMAPPGVSARAG
jgi:hypothetical protein